MVGQECFYSWTLCSEAVGERRRFDSGNSIGRKLQGGKRQVEWKLPSYRQVQLCVHYVKFLSHAGKLFFIRTNFFLLEQLGDE